MKPLRKKKKDAFDWESIGNEYRLNKMSNRMLATKYKCDEKTIRNKAKECGWEKDLSCLVDEKVRTEIIRKKIRTFGASQKQIVSEAAAYDVSVVEEHCKLIGLSRNITFTLLEELQNNDGEKKISLLDRAKVLTQLTASLGKLIDQERQAYNINSGDDRRDETRSLVVEFT